MPDPISGISALRPATAAAGPAQPVSSTGFADTLANVLAKVDASAGQANAAVEDMLAGTGDVHEAMIALQRAESALQITVQVRNKLVQAYQDIMRMPV